MIKKLFPLALVTLLTILISCGGEENDFIDFIPVEAPQDVIQIDSGFLNKRRVFGMSAESFITSRHFVIWWGRRLGNLETEVRSALVAAETSWELAIDTYGMNTPPDANSFYTNIYLSDTGDGIPEDLGTNVYIDFRNVPYVTLDPSIYFSSTSGPNTTSVDIIQEMFKVYMTVRTSFYDPESDTWLAEANPGWLVQQLYPTNIRGLDPVAAFGLNPHLPLWSTEPTLRSHLIGEVLTWSQENHAAGAQIFFTYLTEKGILTPQEVADIFTVDSELSSVEYLVSLLVDKGLNYQDVYLDFCSRNVTWDYANHSTAYQENQETWANEGELNRMMDNSIVSTIGSNGTEGTLNSNPDLAPMGWAYNTYQLSADQDATYNLQFNGDMLGSAGTESDFRLMIVRNNNGQRTYEEVAMSDEFTGAHSIQNTSSSEDIYIVIVSIPNIDSGYESFNYSLEVTKM